MLSGQGVTVCWEGLTCVCMYCTNLTMYRYMAQYCTMLLNHCAQRMIIDWLYLWQWVGRTKLCPSMWLYMCNKTYWSGINARTRGKIKSFEYEFIAQYSYSKPWKVSNTFLQFLKKVCIRYNVVLFIFLLFFRSLSCDPILGLLWDTHSHSHSPHGT